MYSTDLKRITLDDFAEILTSIDLLPSRQILLDNLSEVIDGLEQKGIENLASLQKLLKNKKKYPDLANELNVSTDYLAVLNREVNSYVSKPLPLSKLDVYSDVELGQLANAGLKSTKNLYEHGLTPTMRQELSERSGVSEERIIEGLELEDLLRINGVGPIYAKILRETGIKNAVNFLVTPSQELLANYERVNNEKGYSKVKLGIKDIEYCERFCRLLDVDIEW